MARSVIQVEVVDGNQNPPPLIVLCNDGTLWKSSYAPNGTLSWVEMVAPPS